MCENDKIVKNIQNAIDKTGFILENEIINIFEKYNWNTINNRYYIDDESSKPREIDIIAYKVFIYEDILLYTSLIVSCKKSEKNSWIFLTRKIKSNDPNFDYYPVEPWTNSGILLHMGSKNKLKNLIIKNAKKKEAFKEIYNFDENVFAFQEVNINNSSPQNDKNIYNSIMTAIKAVEYEKRALSVRKKIAVQYNFFLISIFDGDLFSINLSDNKSVQASDHIKYLNRFIVFNEENFHTVHFIKQNSFEKFLKYFDKIHKCLSEENINIIKEFKTNFLNDHEAMNLFKEKISNELMPLIKWKVFWDRSKVTDGKIIKFYSNENSTKLLIELSSYDHEYDEKNLEILNSNEEILLYTKNLLFKYYKYKGQFEFLIEGFPF